MSATSSEGAAAAPVIAPAAPSVHRTRIWREVGWPGQWLGQCRCGRGIRCNDEATAIDFFAEHLVRCGEIEDCGDLCGGDGAEDAS